MEVSEETRTTVVEGEDHTIESIELKVEEHPTEDRVDVDITQVTEEAPASVSQPATPMETVDIDLGTGRDEVIIITENDIPVLSASREHPAELPSENKTYDEWIFVDVNKSTHEVRENLVLLSSVYGGDQACCMLM